LLDGCEELLPWLWLVLWLGPLLEWLLDTWLLLPCELCPPAKAVLPVPTAEIPTKTTNAANDFNDFFMILSLFSNRGFDELTVGQTIWPARSLSHTREKGKCYGRGVLFRKKHRPCR